MKLLRIIFFFVVLFSTVPASAQPGERYSTSNSKAIKWYQEAVQAYEMGLKREALELIESALGKDAAFAEAYLLRAQISSDNKNRLAAIDDLTKVTELGLEAFNDVYFYLGELLMREEAYENADAAFAELILKGSRNKKTLDHARLMRASCAFAQQAKQNPLPFEPRNLGPGINTEAPEYFPAITADGATLLYTREVQDNRVRGGRQEDFFVSRKGPEGWKEAEPLMEINTSYNEGAPSLSADGQWLVFTACESAGGDWGPYQGFASCDLFSSRLIGDQWSKPVNLRQVNSYNWDSQPSYSSDGSTLYFVRGKNKGRGVQEQDIYFSTLDQEQGWSKPQPIPGLVNTAFEEESVMIHPDGQTLYFSSNGHPGMGGLDIFYSKKLPDGSWGQPVNLGYPINTGGDENSILVGPDGEIAYFASDKEGGYGGLDLYSFELPEHARPNPVSFVNGEVFDAFSYKKLEARFELIDLESGEQIMTSYSNPGNGQFLVVLPLGRDYALNVTRPGYLFHSQHFSLKGIEAGDPYFLEIPLEKIEEGSSVVLKNVFFDTDRYDLKAASEVELNRLVTFLDSNPNLRLEIGGHTDQVGSEAENLLLSERRAQAVVSYLVSKGVSESRLKAVGYGEGSPIADNETEAGRALNRRTEMKVLGAK